MQNVLASARVSYGRNDTGGVRLQAQSSLQFVVSFAK